MCFFCKFNEFFFSVYIILEEKKNTLFVFFSNQVLFLILDVDTQVNKQVFLVSISNEKFSTAHLPPAGGVWSNRRETQHE